MQAILAGIATGLDIAITSLTTGIGELGVE